MQEIYRALVEYYSQSFHKVFHLPHVSRPGIF